MGKYPDSFSGKRRQDIRMPVFLMHTIFAAGLRSILVKMGIYDPFIHVTAGILFSFLGPAAAMKIMEKLKWPVFFVYPLKVLRRR